MKRTTLFTAAALVAGSAIPASALYAPGDGSPELITAAVPAAQETATETFESLVAEFDKAQAKFNEDLSRAAKKERKTLRENAPVKAFWPRFEAMGQAGEGRALVWLSDNLRGNRDIKSKDRAAALKPIYAALVADHVNADWFGDAMKDFPRDSRILGLEDSKALLGTMLEKAKSDKTKAAVLYHGATALESEAPEESKAMMARIVEEFGGTEFGMLARAASASPADSKVGKVAPSFMGKSADGFEFGLEDYRGKVTVLDFYGFW